MKLERRHAVLLLAVAVWNVVTFGNFARNLLDAYQAGEERATGYWVAHTILIVGNFVIAALLGALGSRPSAPAATRHLFTLPGDSRRAGGVSRWARGRPSRPPWWPARRPPFSP